MDQASDRTTKMTKTKTKRIGQKSQAIRVVPRKFKKDLRKKKKYNLKVEVDRPGHPFNIRPTADAVNDAASYYARKVRRPRFASLGDTQDNSRAPRVEEAAEDCNPSSNPTLAILPQDGLSVIQPILRQQDTEIQHQQPVLLPDGTIYNPNAYPLDNRLYSVPVFPHYPWGPTEPGLLHPHAQSLGPKFVGWTPHPHMSALIPNYQSVWPHVPSPHPSQAFGPVFHAWPVSTINPETIIYPSISAPNYMSPVNYAARTTAGDRPLNPFSPSFQPGTREYRRIESERIGEPEK